MANENQLSRDPTPATGLRTWISIHGLVLCLLCLLVPWGAAPQAHPSHVSIAEVEHNAETQALEVALRVAPEDLERALELRTERRVQLERTVHIDSLIVAYLNDTFVLSDEQEKRASVVWVGKEVSVKAAWLYFELLLTDDIERARLTNRVFLELDVRQVNTVNLRLGDELRTLTFTHKRSSHSLWK